MKLAKAKKRLEARIKDYDDTCRKDQQGGKGYSKPGSMNAKK